MKKLRQGDLVVVSTNAPFHAGKEGRFEFYGAERSEGCVVLSDPKNSTPNVLFVVSEEHISV